MIVKALVFFIHPETNDSMLGLLQSVKGSTAYIVHNNVDFVIPTKAVNFCKSIKKSLELPKLILN